MGTTAKLRKKKNKPLSLTRKVFEKVKPKLPYLIPGILGVLLILGSYLFKNQPAKPQVQSKNTYQVATSSAVKKEIFVDVEGEVSTPGIYKVDENSRISDIIRKAGGFTQSANIDWIEKYLNMAEKVSDGAKIYIPKLGENVSLQVLISNNSSSENPQNQILNINTASLQQLDTLPGVGEITAKKIIDGRPYEKIEDLKNRKIVNSSVFEKIKDRIRVF